MGKGGIVKVIKLAIAKQDSVLAGNIANYLRFNMGLTYSAQIELVENSGYELADWEELLLESN